MLMPKNIDVHASQSRYQIVVNLFGEIRSVSGLSNAEIASMLNKNYGPNLSDKLISAYISGAKSIGDSRISHIAKAASKCGWNTPTVIHILQWDKYFSVQMRDEVKALLDPLDKNPKSKKVLLRNLGQLIQQLADQDVEDIQIVAATILYTQKYIPQELHTGGGLVNFPDLCELIGVDANGYPVDGWVSWSIKSASDANEEISLISIPRET